MAIKRFFGIPVLFLLAILFSANLLQAQILIVSPHPDDDVIAAAGVIYRAVQRGETVKVVYVTNGDALPGGVARGLERQTEGVNAEAILGVPEDHLMFLGYPTWYMDNICDDADPDHVFVSPDTGLSATYGSRGLGHADYHTYVTGSPASYTRNNVLFDLEDIITKFLPQHIYVTSEFDVHPDHTASYKLLKLALAAIHLTHPSYTPVVHSVIIHWDDWEWPDPTDPTEYNTRLPDWSMTGQYWGTYFHTWEDTGLSWSDRESLDVPLSMQSTDYSQNLKYLAINAHVGEGGASDPFLSEWLHKDEIFWAENPFGGNHPPIVDAGEDQVAHQDDVVYLDGSQSHDPDGTPLTYQWVQGPSDIQVQLSGADTAYPSFTAPSSLVHDLVLTFELVVSDGQLSSSIDAVTVTLSSKPAITTQPSDQTVNLGQTATFSVTASGSAPLSYQWRKNGDNITGAISASYTTPATTAADNGATFRCVVTNTAGSAISHNAKLTVRIPPAVTAQPQNQTVPLGETASFSITATGTAPLSYQWQKNGSDISGATAASYTTSVTTEGDDGATFRCVVTNAAGTATSSSATLTVDLSPVITTQPAGKTVNLGQPATFSIAAKGGSPLNYQWQKNGSDISGATSASYTTPETTAGDNGATFRCVVSNPHGNKVSDGAGLTVRIPPSVTAQPAAGTVNLGQTATFSITATGTAPLSYQWQKNGVDISGATSASYTTPVTTESDDGATFRCVVTNAADSVTSNSAPLTVVLLPVITAQPENKTVNLGQAATFSVTVTGAAPLSYQWQKNGVDIAGATSASYTVQETAVSDDGATFQCLVANGHGNSVSNPATLTLTIPPAVARQPANRSVERGQKATFSVAVSGSDPLSYQWQRDGVDIPGATFPSYTTPPTTDEDKGAIFRCIVTNAAGNTTSGDAVLTVVPPMQYILNLLLS